MAKMKIKMGAKTDTKMGGSGKLKVLGGFKADGMKKDSKR